jgi:hypothetical protein
LVKAVVKASQEPELLFLVGVGVFENVARHSHEVALVLLHSHRTLCHGAELLSVLDHQLTRQVLLAERLTELQTVDESWVQVASGVVVPRRLGRTIQVVRGDGDTLLASVDSEVELRLDYPQPVVGIERLVRVADGGGL